MDTVSIVMATYNGAAFLDEQLRSLADQTLRPHELIVSDDGSTDGTVEMVERFRTVAPFTVTIRKNRRRLGYGENFMSATQLATGDYIAFCDQDDVWHPDKLAIALKRLGDTAADLFVHTANVIDHDGNRIGRFSQGITADAVVEPLHLPPWSVFYGCSMVFPTTLLSRIDPAERGAHTFEHTGMLSHDLWIYFLAGSSGRVVVENNDLIDYRQHGNNVTPTVMAAGLRAWIRSLGIAADPRLPRNDIALHRSGLMSRLSTSTQDPSVRATAARAARYWERIAAYESTRMALYSADRVVRRAVTCGSLVRTGGYRSISHGGLGWHLLLKDLLVGVLPARRLKNLWSADQ